MATVTAQRTDTAETVTYPPQTGIFKHISKAIPYFRNPRHVLILKLDCLLLTWTFIAGIMKEMDQSATTQAYVSGMREALSLYGNELVFFNTYFSIGYAIGLVPGQLAQTRVSWTILVPMGHTNSKPGPSISVSTNLRDHLGSLCHSVSLHAPVWSFMVYLHR
jgi:hypothetical protein